MFCKSCGSQIPDGVKFCSKCGKAVELEQPVNQQTYQPTGNFDAQGFGSEATTVLGGNQAQQPTQDGYQPQGGYQTQPQQQYYNNNVGNYVQEPTSQKKKLSGYMLAIVIMLFVAAAWNLFSLFVNIGSYIDATESFSEVSGLIPEYATLTVVMILLIAYSILLPITEILTAVLILAKKKISAWIYLISKIICYILLIISIVLIFSVGDVSIDDIYSVPEMMGIGLNLVLFVINVRYLFSSDQSKEYFE